MRCAMGVMQLCQRNTDTVSTTSWRKWMGLCAWLTITPDLSGVYEPIPYLQVFLDYVRVGALVANGSGINKCTIEGYLCDVAKIFASVGAKDPRLDILDKIDFRLSSQI